jgi:hypothetical protein
MINYMISFKRLIIFLDIEIKILIKRDIIENFKFIKKIFLKIYIYLIK